MAIRGLFDKKFKKIYVVFISKNPTKPIKKVKLMNGNIWHIQKRETRS